MSIIIDISNIIPYLSSYSSPPLISILPLLFLSLKIGSKSSPSLIGNDEDDDPSISYSTGNSSERHSLRRKLCSPAQANTNSACCVNENGGVVLKIVNHDLNIPNILSITFLREE